MAVLSGNPTPPLAHASPVTTRSIASGFVIDVNESPLFRHRRIQEDTIQSFEEVVVEPALEDCTESSKCLQCTFSEKKTYDACAATGKWQKFECSVSDDETESKYEMRSCKHTDLENGLAMIQFQLFCMLIGTLSIVSVKKQKKLSLSMFDRRKQQGSKARTSDLMGSNKRSEEEAIEFTPMTNQQRERVPLVQRMEKMEII